jgi:hypothetical protein
MGKSSPTPPTAPDPYAVAAAQTKSNVDTANANAALNRVNQVTPWGSLTYTHGPAYSGAGALGGQQAMGGSGSSTAPSATDGADQRYSGGALRAGGQYTPSMQSGQAQASGSPYDNTDQWTATTSLAPAQQALLDSSNKISQSMADLGQNQIGNVQNALAKPLDFSGLGAVQQNGLQSSVASPNFVNHAATQYLQYHPDASGGIAKDIAPSGSIQSGMNMDGVGGYQHSANYGHIQDNLDTSKVPGLVGGDALAQTMQAQQQAAFNQQKAYLDPQWQQSQHDLENQLTQQGVMQNSDAWNRAMDDQNRQRTFAYQNANDQAVSQGNAAQAQLYGQGLSSNQNAFNQALGSGNFANAAQAQGFGQAMSNAQLNNSASSQEFAQKLASMQAANAAQGQQFGQNMGAGQFANAAQGQQYGQNSNDMSQYNAAQGQQFGQSLQNANLNNSAALDKFNSGLANAQLNNQTAGQNFGQSLAARNQGINELMQQQQNPLNVLNALRTGSQVTAPTFGATPQTNLAGTDLTQGFNNQFNAQMGAYNGQVAQNNATTGALGNLAGSAMMYFSDVRLKRDIEQIGCMESGLPVYSYRYVWGGPRQIGVMAHEVELVNPSAVHMHSSGYKMVDYARIG